MSVPNHYELLKVPADATLDQIRRAYRELALKWHPDKSGPEDNGEMFKSLGEAYAILSDELKREAYDAELFGEPEEYKMQTGPIQVWVVVQRQPSYVDPFNPFDQFDPFDIFSSFNDEYGPFNQMENMMNRHIHQMNQVFSSAFGEFGRPTRPQRRQSFFGHWPPF